MQALTHTHRQVLLMGEGSMAAALRTGMSHGGP